jgi:hypothetical protein
LAPTSWHFCFMCFIFDDMGLECQFSQFTTFWFPMHLFTTTNCLRTATKWKDHHFWKLWSWCYDTYLTFQTSKMVLQHCKWLHMVLLHMSLMNIVTLVKAQQWQPRSALCSLHLIWIFRQPIWFEKTHLSNWSLLRNMFLKNVYINWLHALLMEELFNNMAMWLSK